MRPSLNYFGNLFNLSWWSAVRLSARWAENNVTLHILDILLKIIVLCLLPRRADKFVSLWQFNDQTRGIVQVFAI